jgi:hypothetical protein
MHRAEWFPPKNLAVAGTIYYAPSLICEAQQYCQMLCSKHLITRGWLLTGLLSLDSCKLIAGARVRHDADGVLDMTGSDVSTLKRTLH